jgi:hypothetical protein
MEAISTEVLTPERNRDTRGHQLYGEARRRAFITAYLQSGLTQKAFARREGIKYSTFTAWLQRRRGASKRTTNAPPAAAAMRFTELKLPTLLGGGLEVSLPDGTVVRGSRVGDVAALVKTLRG